MLKNLTGKIKIEYLFAAGCLLLLWIGYVLAFQKTWQAWQLHRQLSSQLAISADVSVQPAYLERKDRNLNRLLKSYTADTVNFRSNVIAALSPLAQRQQCRIIAVPAEVQSNTLSTTTYQVQKVSFEGSFFALTKLLQQLEAAPQGGGLVRSAIWHSVELHTGATSQRQLVLDVYLLSLKQ